MEKKWRTFVVEWRTPLQALAVLWAGTPFVLGHLFSLWWLTAAPAWLLPAGWLWWETLHVENEGET